jgi:hypothetical protein
MQFTIAKMVVPINLVLVPFASYRRQSKHTEILNNPRDFQLVHLEQINTSRNLTRWLWGSRLYKNASYRDCGDT